jgi:hypothetical protein
VKQFKARLEAKMRLHAMEMWFEAENIIEAAEYVAMIASTLGYDTNDVKRLTEVDPNGK